MPIEKLKISSWNIAHWSGKCVFKELFSWTNTSVTKNNISINWKIYDIDILINVNKHYQNSSSTEQDVYYNVIIHNILSTLSNVIFSSILFL